MSTSVKIFPAIDIKDKKCVRLIKGDFDNKTEYQISPVEQARKYKLPHIGWNQINIVKDSKIFQNIENNSHMYFVHSYEFLPNDRDIISATTDYSSNIVCSVEKENIFGTQFHPEKSDKAGLKIIDNFINL